MHGNYCVYCDESCHLENDHQKTMVLGALWCPKSKTKDISDEIRGIKIRHNLNPHFEIKWTKVSASKIDFYKDLVDFFFDNKSLHFRALIAPKEQLNHKVFIQSHDDWYYKMYFDMLKIILKPTRRYDIYVDIKDTQGGSKVSKLHDVLCNNLYDFSKSIINRVQIIKSDESEIMQLADMLIGAVSYVNRGLSDNVGKVLLVQKMKELSHYQLTMTTLCSEEKVNIFKWSPREVQG